LQDGLMVRHLIGDVRAIELPTFQRFELCEVLVLP
jgi:hypothetical protein